MPREKLLKELVWGPQWAHCFMLIFSRTFLQTVSAVPVQIAHGRSEQHGSGRDPQIPSRVHQCMRLAREGASDESARRSLMRGRLPSTLPVPARERPRRLAAKARAAVMDQMADQRRRCTLHEKGPAPPKRGNVRAGGRKWLRRNSPAADFHAKDGEMAAPGM